MPSRPRSSAGNRCDPSRGGAERPLASGRLPGTRAGEGDETGLADLHLIPPRERRDVDRLAVDVGAVEAADVAHREAAALAVELDVAAADRHVVQEDVAVGVPPGGGDVLVEQEPATGVGTPLDNEQRGAGRERFDGTGVRIGRRFGDLRLVAGVLAADLGDHAGRLTDPLLGESRAALRAEATALGVLVATSSAVHVCLLRLEGPRRGAPNGPRTAGGRRTGWSAQVGRRWGR